MSDIPVSIRVLVTLGHLNPCDHDAEAVKLFRSMRMKHEEPLMWRTVVDPLKQATPAELAFGEFEQRFYKLVTHDVIPYMSKLDVQFEELPTYFYGLGYTIFGLTFLLERKVIRHDQAKRMLKELFEDQPVGIDMYDYILQSAHVWLDEETETVSEVDAAIDAVLAAHPDAVADYRAGKQKALGSMMGPLLKAAKGDPRELKDKLVARLGS